MTEGTPAARQSAMTSRTTSRTSSDQVGFAGVDHAIHAHLNEEFHRVAALGEDPVGVQGGVAVAAGLAVEGASFCGLRGDEHAVRRTFGGQLGEGRGAVGGVEQEAGGGASQGLDDVGLAVGQFRNVRCGRTHGGVHPFQGVALVHRDDREGVVRGGDAGEAGSRGALSHAVLSSGIRPAAVAGRGSVNCAAN